ncbi:MAG: GspJ family type II secretion system protein [Planctomycetota bacterium]
MNTQRPAHCSIPRAFTLLELLIALAMTALLSTVLYSSMYFGFKSRESATRSLDALQKASNAFALITQDFDGALPPTGILAGEFTGTAQSGGGSSSSGSGTSAGMGASSGGLSTSKSSLNSTTSGVHAASSDGQAIVLLSFFSSANTPHKDEMGADCRKVEFSIETPEGSTRQALVRRVYYNLLPSKASDPRVQVLCRNIRTCYLRYYDGTLWRDDWDSKAQGDILPNAIEVTLTLDVPDTRTGEDLVYTLTHVFAIPCGVSAAQAASGSAQ